MERSENLEFCKKCINRKFDPAQGIICGLTQKVADFEDNCENFSLDESAREKTHRDELVSDENQTVELDEKTIDKLKTYQDFYYAIVGGLLVAIISAFIWAAITVATQYQIGFMAIGVGLLVGVSIRFFGAGIEKKYGYLGAFLSFLGCLLGNLLSQVGFIAEDQGLGFFETISYLNPGIIGSIMVETFNPIDLLFYGIAVYEGYRFAFRKITVDLILLMKHDENAGMPLSHKYRMPLVMTSILILGLLVFKLSRGVNGFKTFEYESGNLMSQGEFKKGKEEGLWTFWYENGEIESQGYYTKGQPDSLWQWYTEEGKLASIGHYQKGIEHGVWIYYHTNGTMSDSGSYFESRRHNLWKSWYENGNLRNTGSFNRNYQDGFWKTYYENGQPESEGNYKKGELKGIWQNYHTDGQLAEEIEYLSDDKVLIVNVWDKDAKQIVKDGNGHFKTYDENGNLYLTGKVLDGKRKGKWNTYYSNGSIQEEGTWNDDEYLINNVWDPEGNQNIENGNGTYISYLNNSEIIFEKGEIKDGMREGTWISNYPSTGTVYQETNYVQGKLSGEIKLFWETGELYATGNMNNGLREGEWIWYYANGIISSRVVFKNDKKEGKQILWSETGQKTKEEHYENGEVVEETLL